MAIRGFRTKIAFNVALLLILSAVITDILVVLVLQGLLVRTRLERDAHLMERVGRLVMPAENALNESPGSKFSMIPEDILSRDMFPAVAVFDRDRNLLYERDVQDYPLSTLKVAADKTLQTGRAIRENTGATWAVFWWSAPAALITVPIESGGRISGAIAAIVPLSPVYAKLRQYNKPVIYYILLNSIILTIAGLYRIFRIYLHPIDRIVRQADDYGLSDDLFITFRREDNELNRLSSALNRMLKRIAEDQQKLKENVISLEMANEELKAAQNEIVRAEKLASVGRLAAGIAHEIGNPIGIVLGYLELIRQPDLNPQELSDFAGRAEKEIQRINTIIRQLLDLARPKESQPQQISVHAVLEDIVGVMGMQPMMSDIRIDLSLEAEQEILRANAEQLRQVFLNLLLNAGDAITDEQHDVEGRIEIKTWNEHPDTSKQSASLVIRFADNGVGIPADQIESVFDPFYTTKAPGKGTGLGLAVSYMVIEEMGGGITVDSRPQEGTRFTIELPIKNPSTGSKDPVQKLSEGFSGGDR